MMATRWLVLGSLVLARIAFAFQFQTLAVVAPGFVDQFSLGALAVGTLVGLYMIPGLFLAIPGGVLSQWIGERRFLLGCLALMVAGGVVCSLAEGYWSLWIGRLLSGIGAIGMNVVMAKIVIDLFQAKEIATAMALFLTGYPAGIALALVTLGTLATPAGWSYAFLATAALGLSALIAFAGIYRASDAPPPRPGVALRPSTGEIGMVCLAGMVWALYNAAYIIVVSFIPLFLHGRGMAPASAASVVGIGLWVAIIAGPLGGMLADRLRRPTALISACVLIWGLGFTLVIPWADSFLMLSAVVALVSFIGNLAPGAMVALAGEVLRPQVRSTGMGFFYTLLYSGLGLGPVLGGLVSDTTGDPAAPVYLIAVLAVLTVITLAVFRGLQARGIPAVIRESSA
jgi:predicted MFS family arabinose efflux permease